MYKRLVETAEQWGVTCTPVNDSLESDLQGLDPLMISSFNDKQAGITVYDTLLAGMEARP